MRFKVTPIAPMSEDGSVRVTDTVRNRSLVVADTGNGGDTAYQVLRWNSVRAEYQELAPFPAYTGCYDQAVELAKRELRSAAS